MIRAFVEAGKNISVVAEENRIKVSDLLAVPILGQAFCYNENHKRGSARFSRLIGHFKIFVDCYCERVFEVLYF